MHADNRAKLMRWFTTPIAQFPTLEFMVAFILIVLGLILLGRASSAGAVATNSSGAAAAAFLGTSAFKGLVACVIGVGIAAIKNNSYNQARKAYDSRISEEELDRLIEQDVHDLSQHALTKVGIGSDDPEALVGYPWVITGPRFWNVSADFLWRIGRDKIARYSPMQVTIINFTPEQVVAYTCALDLRTGAPLNETTDEYFYRDIVSVSTKTKSETHDIIGKGRVHLTAAETFTLTTSGGTSIEVFLRDPALLKAMGGGGEIPTTRAEAAVQTIRKMLREKKSANG